MEATHKDHAALFSVVIKGIENLAEGGQHEFKKLQCELSASLHETWAAIVANVVLRPVVPGGGVANAQQ